MEPAGAAQTTPDADGRLNTCQKLISHECAQTRPTLPCGDKLKTGVDLPGERELKRQEPINEHYCAKAAIAT